MTTDVDAITCLADGLSISKEPSTGDEQVSRYLGSSLRDSIKSLENHARTTATQAQKYHSLAGSTSHLENLNIAEIYSLHKISSRVTQVARSLDETANTLKDAVELSTIVYLTSLGVQGGAHVRDGSLLRRMIAHFDKEIRSIVRNVLSISSGDDCAFWRIAEECYNQANSQFSTLDPDSYLDELDELEEAELEWPFDPDYEAEEYYEHENRLYIDENYAAAFEKRIEERLAARERQRRRVKDEWVEFWVLVLNRCHGGPTLFYPPASMEIYPLDLADADIPRYLFRTFDVKSSGTSDERVVASSASVGRSPGNSKINILSLPGDQAIEMLHAHLKKNCCGAGTDFDNLMSWTSSLPFAIQYAIWRRSTFSCDAAEIKICVVDTRGFPRGQFAQDLSLIQVYRNANVDEAQKFFKFRLGRKDYQNGEYLSQGILHHRGRSCVASLKDLEDSGLYELYPEFADEEGAKRWTQRVLALRRHWSGEEITTH